MKESPLFWPVKIKGDSIHCLDETVLPRKVIYLRAKNLSQAVDLIKKMKTRAFGQVLMVYNIFLLLLNKHKNSSVETQIKIFNQAAEKINKSRPTLPFPFFTDMILSWIKEARDKKTDIYTHTKKNIEGFLAHLKACRVKQAEKLSAYLKDGDSVLTHCNISGSLALAAEFCEKENKKIKFFVTETRPYLQGARLTAWELKKAGFEITVVPDSAAAFLMSQKLVNCVVTGADQMARNGDIANKIGTYQIALLAKQFNIPFYVLSPPPSKAATKDDIKIEIRPEKELLEFEGKRIAPKGVKGFYPAFDLTPRELITKHIPLEI
ncbi:MAG: S-methyl-5-thioribose-1-phosphate isomerase [Candidatus Omnitrophota bacterium]